MDIKISAWFDITRVCFSSLLIGLLMNLSCSIFSPEDPLLDDLPFEVVFSNETTVLRVGSNEVSPLEIRLAARSQIPRTTAHFPSLSDPLADPEPWLLTVKGRRPIDQLRHLTLLETVRTRIKLDLADRFSIRADTSLEAFRRRWEVENLNRKEAAAKGETIYGPVEYSFEEYYFIDLRSLDLALMQRLQEKDLLRNAESFWNPVKGGSRHERMEQLYRRYIDLESARTPVLLNRAAFEQVDLFEEIPD